MTREDAINEDKLEYRRRLAAVRAEMSREGFDAIVSADNGDWFGPTGNARYLSNFNLGHMGHYVLGVVVVVPLRGEPILVVPPGPLNCFVSWARESSWIEAIQSTSGAAGPAAETLTSDVLIALKTLELEHSRIGICGEFAGAPSLGIRLPSADVAPAVHYDATGTPRDLVEQVRRIKSPWEVERLRDAQRCTEVAMTTFMRSVSPGRRQAASAAEADFAAIEAGAEQALTIMNSGSDPWMWWHIQRDRSFASGQVVSLETNARVDGYVAQIARSGVLGPESEAQSRLREVATESLQAMVDCVRPGVSGGDVWGAGHGVVKRAGLEAWGRLGHGMGLSMDEGFALVPGEDYVLEEGVCIEMHASVWDRTINESYLLGEQYLVRGGKAELLSSDLPPHSLAPSHSG